jgi:Tfp pilus assembly protein PilO
MIWREKRVLLLILAALLLGNVVFFLTYRVQYQSRLDEMDQRLAQAEGQLETTRRARAAADAQLQAYKKVERDIAAVFDDHWSTRPRRLTLLIGELKRLADASNAIPQTYTFGADEELKTQTVSTGGRGGRQVAIGANEVSISYSVDASYDQIRRMINLLELSNQFVIIDGVSLSASDENKLTLTLKLKTVFRDEQAPVATNRL